MYNPDPKFIPIQLKKLTVPIKKEKKETEKKKTKDRKQKKGTEKTKQLHVGMVDCRENAAHCGYSSAFATL